MIDVTAIDDISGDARARSNVVRLAAAQALTGANSAVIFAPGSIIGATLAPDLSRATLPLSMYFVGIAARPLPTGAIARPPRRRGASVTGTGAGARRPAQAGLRGGRRLLEIVRQPRFMAAASCGIVAYPRMNLVMTSAPLAMKLCGLGVSDSNFGIQWHIVAMYGPSFFTGSLIARFGAPKVVAIGLLLEACAGAIGLSGLTCRHSWATLVVPRVGW